MKRTLLKSAKVRRATIVVMQKLARTLRAAEKPRKLTHDMPVDPAFDQWCGRLMVSAEAIAGLVGAAALVNVPGRSATTASPPSSKTVAP
jgi:hypothetical protein